jgi:hypothetical protein
MKLTGVVGLLGIGAALAAGCSVGEGDACNPDLSHDECSAGLTCFTPQNCANSYCCPVDNSSLISTLPQCQACPPPNEDASVPVPVVPEAGPAPATEGGGDSGQGLPEASGD